MTTSAKLKQILINIGFIVLAFTIQNCVFPLLPFLAAVPNLLLILTSICFTAGLLAFIP